MEYLINFGNVLITLFNLIVSIGVTWLLAKPLGKFIGWFSDNVKSSYFEFFCFVVYIILLLGIFVLSLYTMAYIVRPM